MSHKPNRGFIKELSKSPEPKAPKKPFTYAKSVTPQSKNIESLQTPSRLRSHSAAPKAKSNLVIEQASHIKKRRGEA